MEIHIGKLNKKLNKKLNNIKVKMKIVDCFTFYNETELLDYRLALLSNVVDTFVIVEATVTFAGKPKELYFKPERYLKFNIVHIVVDDMPLSCDTWTRERHQRNSIKCGIDKLNLKDNDLIIISDIDEIPDPETLKYVQVNSGVQLEQDCYYYNIESKLNYVWNKSKVLKYNWFKNQNKTCDTIRNSQYRTIKKGGWHLSCFGTPEFISNKLQNFSHQEYNNNKFTDIHEITRRINEGIDIVERGSVKITKINPCDNNYLPPGYIGFR